MGLLDNFFNTKAPDYMQGLLGDTTDIQSRANTTGLVNMALGYLAAPKHSQLGLGRILAGSYMAGQQGAQGTYDNALQNWQTQTKIDDYKKAKAKETGLQDAMNQYGIANDNQANTTPETTQNIPAPQGTNAPNFGTVQQTTPAVTTQTPYFNKSKWMNSVLPNLDAKDALTMLTKANKSTWIDGGDKLYQADESGNLTGLSQPKGMSPSFHTIDAGGKTYTTDGINITGSIDKSQTPDSIMSNNRIINEGRLNRQNSTENSIRAHEASAGGDALNGGITPSAIDAAAARYRMDGTIPPMGMGKSAVAIRTQILNKAAEMDVAAGVTGVDARTNQVTNKSYASALTQLSKQKTMVSAFEKNAQLNGDMALKLSDQVDRTGIPIFNTWIQSGQKNVTGNPAVSQFHAANETYINEYAKIMSGSMGNTPVSDSARAHAHSLLSTAQTKEQYKAVMQTLSQEMGNRMQGMSDEESILKQSMSPKGTVQAKPQATAQVLAMPAKPSALTLKSGSIYQTQHGNLKWNGKAFEDIQ